MKRNWLEFLRRVDLESRLFWVRQGISPMDSRIEERKVREVLGNRLKLSKEKISQVLSRNKRRMLRDLLV